MNAEHICKQINEFFGDTSRSRAETREGLEEIGDLIHSLLDALESDDE